MNKPTRELVFDAADELLKEGVKPSQQNIRDRIGKGSATTIHQALGAWWETLAVRMQHQNDNADIPDFLVKALAELWQQALDRSKSELKTKELALTADLDHKKKELDSALEESRSKSDLITGQLERAYSRIEQLQQDLESSRKEVTALEREVVHGSAELAQLRRETKAQNKIIEKLEQNQVCSSSGHSSPLHEEQFAEKSKSRSQLGDFDGFYEDDFDKENKNLKTTISNLDGQLLERNSRLQQSQEELLEIKRRYYRLESGLEGGQAQLKGELNGKLEAKDQEIDRLLALLADKR